MRLTIETVVVKDVIPDDHTCLHKDGILHINFEELQKLVSDDRFASLKIELARPGEECRIAWVGDVIQPRVKTDAPEETFPGMLGPIKQVGSGRTTALEGIAVVEIWGASAPMSQLIDMSGPGAAYTPFSETFNIVVVTEPAPDVEKTEYAKALKKASLTVSRYLATLAIGLPADREEVFELGSPQTLTDADGNELPRFVYIFQVFSTNALVEPLLYGDNCRGMLPMLIHPNEILDGALLHQNYDQILNAESSYVYCNHPVIKDMYRRHGKEINFVGVILKTAPFDQAGKERFAMMAAAQAKYYLNADGAILTKEGGGHPQLDLSLTCQRCEELGIKTVLMITDFFVVGGDSSESLIFNTDKADAIVCNGIAELIDYPQMKKLIGRDRIPEVDGTLREPFRNNIRLMRGSVSQVGNTYLQVVEL